jgi:hypothetical protein
MNTEVVRTNLFTKNKLSYLRLSYENLIRRVANAHGGSHPVGHEPRNPTNDDIVINHLFSMEMHGLPSPYLILIKIAAEILRIEQVIVLK